MNYIHDGIINFKFELKDNEIIETSCLIRNKSQFHSLQGIIMNWYKQNVKIKEKNRKTKEITILLEKGMSYHQKQAFYKEIKQ